VKILFLSHTYIGGNFKVGSHHLAVQLKRLGHEVLHVSTPISPFHIFRANHNAVWERFLIAVRGLDCRNGVDQMVPWSIIPLAAKESSVVRRWLWLLKFKTLERAIRKRGYADVDLLIVDQPLFAGVLSLLRASTVVYRPTDLYGQMAKDASYIHECESRILDMADYVVATSEPVLDHVSKHAPRAIPSIVLENGVDLCHFSVPMAEPAEYANIPRPRAVYVGSLDFRFDWGSLCYAASQLLDTQFVLIGPRPSKPPREVFECRNIHMLGPRCYRTIPGYLQHADIGLLPMSTSGANQGRSPMKFYEYLASGLPVIATETSELARRSTPGVRFFSDKQGFVSLIGGEKTLSSEVRNFANELKAMDWEQRARELLAFVGCR
jgi:glycosyltransferase involved in cell wall biosynthesis